MGTDLQSNQDRRVAPRRRVVKGAKLFFNGDVSVFDCTVRDISETGARVSLGLFQPLPKRFKLQVNDLGTHLCELVRMIGSEYGVRFVAPATIARPSDSQAA
jgi:hypothetical protein